MAELSLSLGREVLVIDEVVNARGVAIDGDQGAEVITHRESHSFCFWAELAIINAEHQAKQVRRLLAEDESQLWNSFYSTGHDVPFVACVLGALDFLIQ